LRQSPTKLKPLVRKVAERVAFAFGRLDDDRVKNLLLTAAEIEYWDEVSYLLA
jgi:hypothetical protein